MWQVLGVNRDAAQAVDDGLLGLLRRGLGANGNRCSHHVWLLAPQLFLQTLLHGKLEQVKPTFALLAIWRTFPGMEKL
jgi:hypothetical protein